eukprot:6777039-Lingulodinium_polyedra.AAC.1
MLRFAKSDMVTASSTLPAMAEQFYQDWDHDDWSWQTWWGASDGWTADSEDYWAEDDSAYYDESWDAEEFEPDWPPYETPEADETYWGKGKKGKAKGKGSDGGCFRCGSKFHRIADCPLPPVGE